MTRIEGISWEEAGFILRLVYRIGRSVVRKLTGKSILPEPFTVAARHPSVLAAQILMEGAHASASSVQRRLKELAIIAAAREIGCRFCMDIGSAVCRKHGVTDEQFDAFDDFEASPAFSAQERAVIRYSIEMSNTPAEVSDSSFAELRRYFNDRQIIELTSMIAFENYRSRFNHALGFQAQGFSEGSICVMPRVKSIEHGSLGRV